MKATTKTIEYTQRLKDLESIWWKRLLPVQAPYRWHLRSLNLGRVLDVGCGIGRNLSHIHCQGVGIDHNAESIAVAKSQGHQAFLPEDFLSSKWAEGAQFDSILYSHILEHLDVSQSLDMINSYISFLKPSGKIIILCPQEAGYRSDETHKTFMDFSSIQALCDKLNLVAYKTYSFPFPRWIGRFFKYNEFVVIARLKPSNQYLG